VERDIVLMSQIGGFKNW